MPKVMFRPAPTPPPFVPPTPIDIEDESILFLTWPFQANESVRGVFRFDSMTKQNPIYFYLVYSGTFAGQTIETNCIFNENGTVSFVIVPNQSSDKINTVYVDLAGNPESSDFEVLNILNS